MAKWAWITLAVVIGSFACVYFFDVRPPVGTYIAVAGLVAVIVTTWPPNDQSSKAIFIAILFFLTTFEVHTLYTERAKQDLERTKQREEERKSFQDIADGISRSITQSQQAFDTTMKSMGSLAQLS